MTIELPWPPSANRYWRHVGSRVVLSREAREYREEVARLTGGKEAFAEGDRLDVRIDLRPPDGRRWDLDNRVKQVLDSLQHGGLYPDDGQVDRLEVVRGPVDRERPRAIVVIAAV